MDWSGGGHRFCTPTSRSHQRFARRIGSGSRACCFLRPRAGACFPAPDYLAQRRRVPGVGFRASLPGVRDKLEAGPSTQRPGAPTTRPHANDGCGDSVRR